MAYRVGQILFVVLNKKMQVYPMMVVEEITKRTLQGEEMNYLLQGGPDPSITIFLNQVDGEIFESADEAKYVLSSRATSQVEKLVDAAVSKAELWYSTKVQEPSTEVIMSLPQSVENKDSDVQVELPDGTIAKLKSSMVG
jgi:hypothetical protein